MSDVASPPSTTRGETVIGSNAVARIAEMAAREVDGVEVTSRSGTSRLMARASGRNPSQVGAEVASQSASVDLKLRVAYPMPLRRTVAQVRDRVTTKVQALTGLQVEDLRLSVDELSTTPEPRRRVLS